MDWTSFVLGMVAGAVLQTAAYFATVYLALRFIWQDRKGDS
jgi:hypothetical protein